MESIYFGVQRFVYEVFGPLKFPLRTLTGQAELLAKLFFGGLFVMGLLATFALVMLMSGDPIVYQVLNGALSLPVFDHLVFQFMIIAMLHYGICISWEGNRPWFYYVLSTLMLIVLSIILWSPIGVLAATAFVAANYLSRTAPSYC